MGTDQLLDLFHVNDLPSAEAARPAGGAASATAAAAALDPTMDALNQLCEQDHARDEYAAFNVDSFLQSMH